jgi:hypothetical protein
MCFRSGNTLIWPVVNRQESRARPFFFHAGKPMGRPFRRPFLESVQFLSARESPPRPLL